MCLLQRLMQKVLLKKDGDDKPDEINPTPAMELFLMNDLREMLSIIQFFTDSIMKAVYCRIGIESIKYGLKKQTEKSGSLRTTAADNYAKFELQEETGINVLMPT